MASPFDKHVKHNYSNGHLRFRLLLGRSSELLRVCLSALPDSFLKGLYGLAVEGWGRGCDNETK